MSSLACLTPPHSNKQTNNTPCACCAHRYESVVREKEDLRSRLDMSGSGGGPLTEQKYQVRLFVCFFGKCVCVFVVFWVVDDGRGKAKRLRAFVCGCWRVE